MDKTISRAEVFAQANGFWSETKGLRDRLDALISDGYEDSSSELSNLESRALGAMTIWFISKFGEASKGIQYPPERINNTFVTKWRRAVASGIRMSLTNKGSFAYKEVKELVVKAPEVELLEPNVLRMNVDKPLYECLRVILLSRRLISENFQGTDPTMRISYAGEGPGKVDCDDGPKRAASGDAKASLDSLLIELLGVVSKQTLSQRDKENLVKRFSGALGVCVHPPKVSTPPANGRPSPLVQQPVPTSTPARRSKSGTRKPKGPGGGQGASLNKQIVRAKTAIREYCKATGRERLEEEHPLMGSLRELLRLRTSQKSSPTPSTEVGDVE